MKAGIAGIVKMECVVQTDGTPSDIRVVAPLDPTVDAAAIQALKGWKFSPGQKDGQAVPVLVQVEMSFTTVRGPRLGSTDVSDRDPESRCRSWCTRRSRRTPATARMRASRETSSSTAWF